MWYNILKLGKECGYPFQGSHLKVVRNVLLNYKLIFSFSALTEYGQLQFISLNTFVMSILGTAHFREQEKDPPIISLLSGTKITHSHSNLTKYSKMFIHWS